MISYYLIFIAQLSKRCASLRTEHCESIIQGMKTYRGSELILLHPKFSYPFIWRPDASILIKYVIFSQVIASAEQVILYTSRTVSECEKSMYKTAEGVGYYISV